MFSIFVKKLSLNTSLYIAQRIASLKKDSFSGPILKIGITGIALGVVVMILAISIVIGFQDQISDKVIGFGAHIQINKYDFNTSYESDPISMNQEFYPSLTDKDQISHIQVYAYKAGIIKTKEFIQGVVLKGVGKDFEWSFFEDKLIKGSIIDLTAEQRSNDVIISSDLARLLKLDVDDDLRMYFVSADQQTPRGRRFKIVGIYETGLTEFDNMFILGDIRHIQRLNRWTKDQIAGFEVFVSDFDRLDEITMDVYREIGYDLQASTIKSVYPQIFNWLDLMDLNVVIILALMILVTVVTIISILLIVILEHTNTIGVLKALGATNALIRKIFIYNTLKIGGIGILIGNIVGIGLCVLQLNTGLIKLDQSTYYLETVPIDLNMAYVLLINIISVAICAMMLIIPSMIIGKISPIKAIRFN